MSLKIALLTNYPLVDNVTWKRKFVKECLDKGFSIGVFYGKKDLKSLVLNFLKKRKYSRGVANKARKRKGIKNVAYFKSEEVPVFQYNSLNSQRAILKIQEGEYDIVVVALDQILSKSFIKAIDSKIVNIHYGRLPEIKGTSALEWTYLVYQECAITLHYIDAGIDTGEIINIKRIPVDLPIDFSNLREKVQEQIPFILQNFLHTYKNREAIKTVSNEGGHLYTFMHPDFIKKLTQ